MDDFMGGRPADAVGPGDLAQAHSVLTIAKDGCAIEFKWPSSDMPSLEPGAPHAGSHPLDDQRSLQFRDGADDDHDGAAQWTAGIDLLAEADELDAEPVHLIQHFEEMPYRSRDPIRSPDQDDIEAATTGIPHQFFESGAARLRAADPVFVCVDDLIAALCGHLLEIEKLGLEVLINSADTRVKNSTLAHASPFE